MDDCYGQSLTGILSLISEQLNKIETENPDEQLKHYPKSDVGTKLFLRKKLDTTCGEMGG